MGYKAGSVNPVVEAAIPEEHAEELERIVADELGGVRGAKSSVIREALAFWLWSRENNSRKLATFLKTYDPGVTAGRGKGSKNKT